MVEVKGDDRTNDDSKIKLKLGSKWADKAGDKYSYCISVFCLENKVYTSGTY